MTLRSQIAFRVTMLLSALALAAISVWILLPEFARSGIARLPTNLQAASAAADARARAAWAADLGGVRGDLWTALALTYASPLWPGAEPGMDPRTIANEARAIIERALAYAPHDSSIWLLAASLASQFNWQNSNPAAALAMSYYTGPNELDLIPLRLLTATRSNALSNDEVRQLVRRDIRMILTHWPELRPALGAAYEAAGPDARHFLGTTIAGADSTFLQTLRAGTHLP
jgi:hypothetical protein